MKETIVALLSSFKFAMTFPVAILEFGFGFAKTIIWTNIGGTIGILFFTYTSEIIIRFWQKTLIPILIRNKIILKKNPLNKTKKIFTRKNRRIISIKKNYGMAGIALLTPSIFSIPVGAFLAVRYFHSNKMKVIYLLISNLIWSLIFTLFYTFFYEMVKYYFP